MWSIALRTLAADRGKLATALVGVVFSIVLVNVQGGLFVGLLRKASLLVDLGQADIWVGHKWMHNVDFPREIPQRWVDRIRSVDGVAAAEPYRIGHCTMTLPSGGFEDVVVVGCDRASLLGGIWNVNEGSADRIRRAQGVIVDRFELAKFEYPRVGDLRELGGRRAQIVAFSQGIVGFLVTPYVFTTLEESARYLHTPPETCSYFLVKLRPGADALEVRDRIRRRVPRAEVFTSDEYARMSVHYWMTRTGLGISFGAATLLGLLVGLIVVAQTLYASVLDRLSEFAALKAMGARDAQIFRILFIQATALASSGAVFGLGLVLVIERAFSAPQAPIVVPWWMSWGSCALVLAICLVSSLLPYLRIRKLDPQIVLQT
jgi:putative ABC transport system permease protein